MKEDLQNVVFVLHVMGLYINARDQLCQQQLTEVQLVAQQVTFVKVRAGDGLLDLVEQFVKFRCLCVVEMKHGEGAKDVEVVG